MAGALRVFAGPDPEVEDNGYQVSAVVSSGFGGGSYCCEDGVQDSKVGGLFLSDEGSI